MRIMVIGLVAFLVGVGGGTFLAKAPEVAEEAVPETAATTTSPGVSTPPSDADGGAALHAAMGSSDGEDVAPVAITDDSAGVSVARLVALFGRLPAADIPTLMGLMTDQQVEQVLRAMSIDRAAAVLQAMPSERGAYFSRRLLLPAGGGP